MSLSGPKRALVIVFLSSILGCQGPSADVSPTPIGASDATAIATEASPVLPNRSGSTAGPLTREALENAEYSFGTTRIKLVNGSYAQPAPAGFPEPYLAAYSLRGIIFGDLDGDRIDDALVTIVFDPSGTYVSTFMFAMINKDSLPEQAGFMGWGDRDRLNGVSIDNGLITVNVTLHAPRDAFCCPTENKIERYRLVQGALVAQPRALTSIVTRAVAASNVRELPHPASAAVGSLRPGDEVNVIGRSREHGSLLIYYPQRSQAQGWIPPSAVTVLDSSIRLLPFVMGSVDLSYPGGGATFYPKAQSFAFDEDVVVYSVALHMRREYGGFWSLRVLSALPAPSAEMGLVDRADLERRTLAAAEVSPTDPGWVSFSFAELELEAGKTYFLFLDGHGSRREGPDAIWSQSSPRSEPGPLPTGQGWVFVYGWSDNSNFLPEARQAHYDHAFQVFYTVKPK